jgi:hypothetical protein
MESNTINNATNKVAETTNNAVNGVADFVSNIKANVNNSLDQFSNQSGATSSFSSSNSIIAKFAFFILIVISFMFLLSLGISLIGYFILPSSNPYIIKGMVDGSYPVRIPQNPNDSKSVPILKSNNQSTGMEFSWSTWVYLNDLGTSTTKYQHIFSKGNNVFNEANNIASVNNAPGLYLVPSENTFRVIMNTVSPDKVNEIVDISNIPIKKWVNVIIRLQNTVLDIYINGTVSKRIVLQYVPKQNYDDIFVCQNGGFVGKLADLRYFNRALNIFEINSLVSSGPNTSTSELTADQTAKGNYSYLSNLWYASKL